MSKPILCLDFDGVCHSYTSGWNGPTVIQDQPVAGMWRFIEAAIQHFDICIHSSRSNQDGGIEAMRSWFLKHASSGYQQDIVKKWLKFPTEKPPAFLSIDDRAITFTGVWPDPQELRDFRPWNKK